MFSEKLLERLKHAYAITALTSGDLSTESNLLSFEQDDELWDDQKVCDVLSKSMMQSDPQQYWRFVHWYREKIKETEPNLGHYTLVDFEKKFKGFALITQTIDGLHRKAGNKRILELKGNILITRCLKCNELYDTSFEDNAALPVCKKCSGIVRPNVIMPDEELNKKLLEKAQEIAAGCDVFFAIGTTNVQEPVASLPYLAKGNGAYIVEINPQKTNLTPHADEYIFGAIDKILPQLIMTYERIS
jgi:NAD-dependent deacetylase